MSLLLLLPHAGEFWVNEVPIVGWTTVENGVIFALGDYLASAEELMATTTSDDNAVPASNKPREYHQSMEDNEIKAGNKEKTTTTTTTTITATTTTPLPYDPSPKELWIRRESCREADTSVLFRRIVVCTEEWVDPNSPEGKEEIRRRKEVRKDFPHHTS